MLVSNLTKNWYIRGTDKNPSGPFTAQELLDRMRGGKLSSSTICWREGMPQWLPLERVEPFASAVGRDDADRSNPELTIRRQAFSTEAMPFDALAAESARKTILWTSILTGVFAIALLFI